MAKFEFFKRWMDFFGKLAERKFFLEMLKVNFYANFIYLEIRVIILEWFFGR
jgi:hypothetical protein